LIDLLDIIIAYLQYQINKPNPPI